MTFTVLYFIGCQSCQPYALATFRPQKIPLYSFPLEAKWTPGLLNEDRRIRSHKKFPGPKWESSPGPAMLWSNASTNLFITTQCITLHYNTMYYKVIFLLSALCLLYLYLIQNHDQNSQNKYYLTHMHEYGVIHDLMS